MACTTTNEKGCSNGGAGYKHKPGLREICSQEALQRSCHMIATHRLCDHGDSGFMTRMPAALARDVQTCLSTSKCF